MKKLIVVFAAISFIAVFASCSNEENIEPKSSVEESSEISETDVETESETTTEAVTETETQTKPKATAAGWTSWYRDGRVSLEEEIEFDDIIIYLPKDYVLSKKNDLNYYFSFEDTSSLCVMITPNTSGESFADTSKELLYEMLEVFSSSFASEDIFVEKGEIKRVILKDKIIVSQELITEKTIGVAYHLIYNEKIYSFIFMDDGQMGYDSIALSNAGKMIKSIEYIDDQPQIDEELTMEKTEKDNVTESSKAENTISKSQENAVKEAKSYIKISDFSRMGLIEQLEYEKYSYEDAVYGADNCGADWYAEALESAKDYVKLSDFSYSSLYDQLVYEKYTADEARYGVDNCGADWFAEAEEAAKNYLSILSFSRDELYDQLLYEGFTPEQAEHGVSSVGY